MHSSDTLSRPASAFANIQLKDRTLIHGQGFINGAWVDADGGGTFPVHNPANGTLLGHVPSMGQVETARAIAAAENAWGPWRKLLAKERAAILRRWCEQIIANADDLAAIMTAEMGKPLAEARGEVMAGAAAVEWAAEEAKRIYGETIPQTAMGRRTLVIKQPIGVCAAITPWNFPISMITRKAAPALAAGCPVVLKPAEATPFCALALAELAARAGIPSGVLNIVTGPPAPIGEEMTSNPTVRKISFTGSTRVGKLLMAAAAGTVKKVSLELGGHAPFIVFDDADLEAAVNAAVTVKFRNSGQTCICANRILVQESIYDSFAEKFTAAAAKLKVADGFSEGTTQGPLINEAAVAKVESHVADAKAKGAKVLLGGGRHDMGHSFFQPTVLADVTGDMRIAREETFGPVAPLFRFKTEEEAIAIANDSQFGLAAYFYSRDIGRIWRVGEALEYGMIGINEGLIATEATPFGGFKESGIGRESGKYGIEEYLEVKYLCMGGIGG